jgi:predicted transcriptional regulator
MNLTVRIPDDLAKRLTAVGASPERVALEALQHAADDLERGQRAAGAAVDRTPAEAAARMRRSRPGNVLPEGMTVRDLMTYGRA